jgi:pyruvate ferredoxin oxidoreductase alpha subunit
MAKVVAVTGNEACANALRQVNPDVCGIYPITPQTDMMQRFASYIADGKVNTEPILVESDHRALH